MERVITKENVEMFAYTNGKLLKGTPRGIVLSFHGLSNSTLISADEEPGYLYADADILYVFPYYAPWGWMNKDSVGYVDAVLDALIDKYDLPCNIPVASTGGSMGGLSALVYTYYAKRTPACCAANSPVCDLPYHYTERPDLPRTLYCAFFSYEGTLEDAMKTASPIHLAPTMPDVPYFVIHGDADTQVNKAMHSDRFVAELKATPHNSRQKP